MPARNLVRIVAGITFDNGRGARGKYQKQEICSH
jgi:hypothetical protein